MNNNREKNCEKYFNLIDDLVEGELAAQIAGQTEPHVFACSECRSHYENRRREKEIYAHFLFDAEPPPDLWANFQATLAAGQEKFAPVAAMPANVTNHKTGFFDFLSFFPSLAGAAAVLLVCGIGFGWLKFAPNETDGDDKYVAEIKPSDSLSETESGEIENSKTTDLQPQIKSGENDNLRNDEKPGNKKDKSAPVKARNIDAADKKSVAAETVKIKQRTVAVKTQKTSSDANKPNAEERAQRLRLKNLENEIAGQIERVEMLLRSFRNARAIEVVATFDVGYEKAQARRLLEKNARLRLEAETYGINYAEELLSRVEPYLLDIANLENNPAPGKVLDIKERVSSQNIIASLQVY